ncbi:MAG: cupin domain-containing protein [Megamonas funiformis]|jgi:quercetin dioxygenase-like cupin family protein|uniref:cupin domain-containing protein n=1 Tax=Megamonas funiformis TaxID=437897 RepID=UPI003990625A
MIFTEHEIVRKEKANGGKGHIIIEHLLTKNELKEQCSMFAHVTLEPNCSLGYHEHHGNGEAYYITKGSGLYSDNGNIIEVKAGDVVFCPDGEGHGIENTSSSENLEFTALIINTVK